VRTAPGAVLRGLRALDELAVLVDVRVDALKAVVVGGVVVDRQCLEQTRRRGRDQRDPGRTVSGSSSSVMVKAGF
jgi:hypothetical protein